MYVIFADIHPIFSKHKECHQTLQLIVERCLVAKGCRDASYTIDPEKENTFKLLIEWNEKADWKNFKQAKDYKALMGMKHLLSRDLNFTSTKEEDRKAS